MNLSIVLPCKDDGKLLKLFVEDVLNVINKVESIECYEIIIVDESKVPSSLNILNEIRGKYNKFLKIIHFDDKIGLLGSELIGLMNSLYEYKIVMDCDFQHLPGDIPYIIEKLGGGADMVIGSRFLEGSKFNPYHNRFILRSIFKAYIRVILPFVNKLTDPTSGFFAIDGNVKIKESNFYGSKTLLFLLAYNSNITVAEVPISFGTRKMGKSKLFSIEYLINYPLEILKFRKVWLGNTIKDNRSREIYSNIQYKSLRRGLLRHRNRY